MTVSILVGDCREQLRTLADGSVNCIVTSPPYFGLRDYGMADQIGLEDTPDAFVAELVAVFHEARRVLADDGTLWLNLGDSYNAGRNGGHAGGRGALNIGRDLDEIYQAKSGANVPGLKPKDLIGIPWRVAFALQNDGWYLRQDIIWHKPNPMPESVTDRCTKSHEYVFLLSKSPRYFYDAEAISEPANYPEGPGDLTNSRYVLQAEHDPKMRTKANLANVGPRETRNKRSVWSITTKAFSEAHFATMPPELADTCIKAGCPKGGTVLDPFGGAGTTGLSADRLNRNAILIELNPEYASLARNRISADAGIFGEVA